MRPLSHQRYDRLQAKARLLGPTGRGTSGFGTLLPGANAAVCQQLAKADFASSSQHVREGQRIAALDAAIVQFLYVGR
jgi:hypothetical protein